MLDDLLRAKNKRSWEGLTELMTAVECDSTTKAAKIMGIEEDQLREQISILEDGMCTKILHPTAKDFQLTEMGSRFVRRCSGVLEEIEDIEVESRNRRWFCTRKPAGVLRIGAPHLLGERYIIPALAEFMKLHPNLDVELNFHSGKVDLAGRGYDISIEVGVSIEPNYVSHTLATNRFHVCGSPSYLGEYGTPTTPSELQNHNVLLFSQNGQVRPWCFQKDDKQMSMRLTPKWYSNNGDALLIAARHDVGLAYLPSYCVIEDLNNGKLVSVLDDWSQHEEKIQLIHLHRNNPPTKIVQFIEFISDRFQKFPETTEIIKQPVSMHDLSSMPS